MDSLSFLRLLSITMRRYCDIFLNPSPIISDSRSLYKAPDRRMEIFLSAVSDEYVDAFPFISANGFRLRKESLPPQGVQDGLSDIVGQIHILPKYYLPFRDILVKIPFAKIKIKCTITKFLYLCDGGCIILMHTDVYCITLINFNVRYITIHHVTSYYININ